MTPERESLERDVAGMRARRSVTGVWMAAVFGFGWLAAGYAIGIVISMLIDFVPDATQTITPLLLVPLTVALWAHWYALRTLPRDPRTGDQWLIADLSNFLTAIAFVSVIAATPWIPADISSNSMHVALAVDIGAGWWLATLAFLQAVGRGVR